MTSYDFAGLKNIDVAAGLKYSEREDTYAEVLGDFHRFIDKNAGLISFAVEIKSLDDYVREVHKLKSAARLIGATELSQLALALEMGGREGNWSVIEKHTPELLAKYREFEKILRPFARRRPAADGSEILREELQAELKQLRELVSAYDYDGAMEIITRLDGRVLPTRIKSTFEAMRDCVESYEFDEAENYVNQMLEG